MELSRPVINLMPTLSAIIRILSLRMLPSSFLQCFQQLNDEYFTLRPAQIRLRRQQLPTDFPN
jgi:hypothetical protein